MMRKVAVIGGGAAGMMAAAGWDFGRLITRLIELGAGA